MITAEARPNPLWRVSNLAGGVLTGLVIISSYLFKIYSIQINENKRDTRQRDKIKNLGVMLHLSNTL